MNKENFEFEFFKDRFVHFQDRGDLWKDVTPVEQFSENVKVLKIRYSDQYKEIMDYFRGIIAKNEISKRAFDLTTEVINENAMNYMAWHYRRKCLDNLKELSLENELYWLDSIMVENQKNYQIWMHRKVIIDKLNDCSHEFQILSNVYNNDSKNFHAWCHRIWVMRRFNIYQNELDFIEEKLDHDIKNNSVWNYRFFIINYSKIENKECKENIEDIILNEINYSLEKIKKCKVNESAYSYLRGYLTKFNKKYADYPQIKQTLLDINQNGMINHALSMLLDIYEEEKNKDECNKIIDDLVYLDYIRKKYWLWRKSNLNFN